MSVLIKGMKMPKNCAECLLNHEAICEAKGCLVIDDCYEKIASWCPIVEVPPHGRLIDSYTLEDELGHFCEDYWVFNTVWHAPTIIEAEMEE